jgi:dsRNA-specific ribonuclease
MNIKKLYEDEMYLLNQVLALEDTEAHDGREFRVDSTEALLDLDSTMAHLYQFCATLPAKEYVDLRPDFICSDDGRGQIRCQVILPLSVNANLRKDPKEELGVLADTESVKYVIERRKLKDLEDGEGREYWCKVFVGEDEVVEASGEFSKEEVKTKAAERAVIVLKAGKLGSTSGGEATSVDVVDFEGGK